MELIRTWQEVDKEITKVCPSCSEIVTKRLYNVTCEEVGFNDMDSFLNALDKEGLESMLKTSMEEERFELCEKIKDKLNKK